MFRLILAISFVLLGSVAEARTHRTKVTIVHKHVHHHISTVAMPVQTYSVAAPVLTPEPVPAVTYYAAPIVVRSQTRKERKRAERAASTPSVSVTVQN